MNNILLVEDDTALALGMEYTLKNEGFKVKVVNNIEGARGSLHLMEYELILLDVMLPDGNGYDFCKEVREKSDIPIIFLTACDEEVNVVLGLDIGGDDYITKPFRLRELISRIKAVLRRRGKKKDKKVNILNSGNIDIYILEGKVNKNKEQILLTAVEYKLLLLFSKHPKQILTRNTILEELWDLAGEFVDDNTLSVYIRRIREKIEDNPAKPEYIVTARGLGYKWNMEVRGN